MNIICQESDMTELERDLVDKAPANKSYDWNLIDWKNARKDECFECKKEILKNVDIHSDIFALPFGKGHMCVESAGYILCEDCTTEKKKEDWKLTMVYPYRSRPLYADKDMMKKARISDEDCIIEIKINGELSFTVDV